MIILFPSSFFDYRKVDEDLQSEYEAVVNTGLFETNFFDYNAWFDEGRLKLVHRPEQLEDAVYRGWMMKPDKYRKFYQELFKQNIRLVTTPEEYEKMHVFPNVYECFGEDTAQMDIFPLHAPIDVTKLKKKYDRFMVKDFVKSVKGTEFPKYFDQTVTQDEFDKWMETFYKYRGNLLTGGICIKEYLELKKYDGRTNESRVFYVNHEVASVSPNSAQPSFADKVPQELIEKYKNLDSVYYTVDYAQLSDGSWKVLEAGDGSVSGLSEFQDAQSYFRALYCCLNA